MVTLSWNSQLARPIRIDGKAIKVAMTKTTHLIRSDGLQHVTFWLLLWITMIVVTEVPGQEIRLFRWSSIHAVFFLTLASSALVVYANLHILLPKFLLNGKYLQYIVMLVTSTIVSAFVLMEVISLVLLEPPPGMMATNGFTVSIVKTTILVLFTSSWYFSKRYQEMSSRVKEIDRQKTTAELDALKAQLHPHFLFNTLNNIYSFELDKSSGSSELILQLSEIMRYILYECAEPMVPINKELAFIRNYLALERVRVDDFVRIDFNAGHFSDDQRIAPLLLITFIENAFKHGVKSRLGDAYVQISIEMRDATSLHFVIENDKDQDPRSEDDLGIGIENAIKRLDLIYGERYALRISDQQSVFRVELSIDL